MNDPAINVALGSSVIVTSKSVYMNTRLHLQGQAMHTSAALLPESIDPGIRRLVYVGDTDTVCNYLDIQIWMDHLEHALHREFVNCPPVLWKTHAFNHLAGEARSAGSSSGPGNVTFVRIYNAGHMAPHDQPEAALDMITCWLHDISRSDTTLLRI